MCPGLFSGVDQPYERVKRIFTQDLIEELPSDGPDQPLNKGMREGNVGNRFDLLHVQDAQVGLPLMIFEKRIVIGIVDPNNWTSG
jgi:hypothetical protein